MNDIIEGRTCNLKLGFAVDCSLYSLNYPSGNNPYVIDICQGMPSSVIPAFEQCEHGGNIYSPIPNENIVLSFGELTITLGDIQNNICGDIVNLFENNQQSYQYFTIIKVNNVILSEVEQRQDSGALHLFRSYYRCKEDICPTSIVDIYIPFNLTIQSIEYNTDANNYQKLIDDYTLPYNLVGSNSQLKNQFDTWFQSQNGFQPIWDSLSFYQHVRNDYIHLGQLHSNVSISCASINFMNDENSSDLFHIPSSDLIIDNTDNKKIIDNIVIDNLRVNNINVNNLSLEKFHISDSSITTNSLVDLSVNDFSVKFDNINNHNINNSYIRSNYIYWSNISNSSVSNSSISSQNISNSFLNNGSITYDIFNTFELHSSRISTTTISNSSINNHLVENSSIDNNSINLSYIRTLNINNNSSVSNSIINNSSVSNNFVSDSIIVNSRIQHSNINQNIVNNSSISNSSISNSSITNNLIDNSNIDEYYILNNSFIDYFYVYNTNISNSSVSNSSISSHLIESSSDVRLISYKIDQYNNHINSIIVSADQLYMYDCIFPFINAHNLKSSFLFKNNFIDANFNFTDHYKIYFDNNIVSNKIIIVSKTFTEIFNEEYDELYHMIRLLNNNINELQITASCMYPKFFYNTFGKLYFNNFNSYDSGLYLNNIYELVISNNKYLRELCLDTNTSQLTSLKLYDNVQLYQLDIPNNNIINMLHIYHTPIKNLVITQQNFPSIKKLHLVNNFMPFELNHELYSHHIIYENKVIEYDNSIDYEYSYEINDIYKYPICLGQDVQYTDKQGLNKFLNVLNIKFQTYCQTSIIFYYHIHSLPELTIYQEDTLYQNHQNNFVFQNDIAFEELVFQNVLLPQQLTLNGSSLIDLKINCTDLKVLDFTSIGSSIETFDISNNKIEYFTNNENVNTITNTNLMNFNANNNNFLQRSVFVLNDNKISVFNDNNKLYSLNLNNNRITNFTHSELNNLTINNQYYEYKDVVNGVQQTIGVYTLKIFNCDNLQELSINSNPNLQTFISRYGRLKNLSLSNFSKLKTVDISNSKVPYLNLLKASELDYLNIENCVNIDVIYSSKKLRYLNCNNTKLQQINISDAIEQLYCNNNLLTELKYSLPNIRIMDASNNKINYVYFENVKQDSNINLRNNIVNIMRLKSFQKFSNLQFDNVELMIMENINANYLLQSDMFNNIKKLVLQNINDQIIELNNKNIQYLEINDSPNLKIIHINNSDVIDVILNCKNGYDTQFTAKNSKIEKIVIKKNNLQTLFLQNNFIRQINVFKSLNNLKYFTLNQNNGDLDLQKFLRYFYDSIKNKNFDEENPFIKISSDKILPYYQISDQLKQLFEQKNFQISAY